jgi:hypothetical protein
MAVKRGVIVWITGFITFLFIIASVSMIFLSIHDGPNSTIPSYLLGDIIPSLTVEIYLWISITATFIFLGLTCVVIYLKQPPNPELVKLLLKVGGNVAALRKSQEASMTEMVNQMEYNKKVNQKLFNTISTEIKENKNEMLDLLDKQEKVVKKLRSNLSSIIETKTSEIGEKISIDLKKQEAVLLAVKRLNEEGSTSLKNQLAEMEDLKLRLEKIEGNMVPNESSLKSLDNSEEIKGIGPALGSELRMLGINTVGDFLTTDPDIIGEKTRISKEMAENLQASAQLMMIPGVDSNDAEILIEAGVKSQKELRDYDLLQLSRKVGEIAKIHLAEGKISEEEFPTIEEISYWIRMSK